MNEAARHASNQNESQIRVSKTGQSNSVLAFEGEVLLLSHDGAEDTNAFVALLCTSNLGCRNQKKSTIQEAGCRMF